MLPAAKTSQVQFNFCNDSQNPTTGTFGMAYRGRYNVGGTQSGTYTAIIYNPITIRRVIMTTNGDEYTGGTFEARLSLGPKDVGLTEVYNSGVIPFADWVFQASFSSGSRQDSCQWVSPVLDIYLFATPLNPRFLGARFVGASITGSPEGVGLTVITDMEDDIGSSNQY